MKKKKKNEFFSPERRRKPVTVSDILSRNAHVALVCLLAGNMGLNHSPPCMCFQPCLQFIREATHLLPDVFHVLMPHVSGSSFCLLLWGFHVTSHRSRNNSKLSGSQQDYFVVKSGSPQIYVVVIRPRFKQNNTTNTKFEKYFQIWW